MLWWIYLVIVHLTSAKLPNEELYRHIDCKKSTCKPSYYQSLSELVNVAFASVEATTVFSENFTISKGVEIDTLGTPSYVLHKISSNDDTENHFHSDLGITILKTPTLGNGFWSNITFNVTKAGMLTVYFLEENTDCSCLSQFWRCLNSSAENYDHWEEVVSPVLKELQFSYARRLEDTFYIKYNITLELFETGVHTANVGLPIQKGTYLGFESVNATVLCNRIEPAIMLSYANYSTPTESTLVPFFSLEFNYKTYQPYNIEFIGSDESDDHDQHTDVIQFSNLNISNGTLKLPSPISGYFLSYSVTLNIPQWHSLFSKFSKDPFSLAPVIDGYFVNVPVDPQTLVDFIDADPPSVITGPSVVYHPRTLATAKLENNTDVQSLFLETVVGYEWVLIVLPSNVEIYRSNEINFRFDSLVLPSTYRLTVLMDTIYNITFTSTHELAYVQPVFTVIRCLLNCDAAKTSQYTRVRLSVDVDFPYGVLSAKWDVTDMDKLEVVTDSVTEYNYLVELAINTALLTGSQYAVDLIIDTDYDINVHERYQFNMSHVDYSLLCTATPDQGITLKSYYNISCNLTIDGIACDECIDPEDEDCTLCLLNYRYFFRACSDYESCELRIPLFEGSSSQPIASGVVFPVGKNNNFTVKAVVSMYHETEFIEYLNSFLYTVSAPNDNLNISELLGVAGTPGKISELLSTGDTFKALTMMNAIVANGNYTEQTINNELILNLLSSISIDSHSNAILVLSLVNTISQDKDSVSGNSMKGLMGIATQALQTLHNASKAEAQTGNSFSLSTISNTVQTNVEIADAEVLPELNFVFATDSADEQYFNKWINFDYDAEIKLQNDADRSAELSKNIKTLQKFASMSLEGSIILGETYHFHLPSISYSMGRFSPAMLATDNRTMGHESVYLPSFQIKNTSFTDTISLSYIKFQGNPFILTPNSNRIKSMVVGISINKTDSEEALAVEQLDGPIEVLIPHKKLQPMSEYIYDPELGRPYFQLDLFVPGNSALFVQVKCSRTTTLYFRSLELPQTTAYEFTHVFPNNTFDAEKNEKISGLSFSHWTESNIFNVQVPFHTNGTHYLGVDVATKSLKSFSLQLYVTSCLIWNTRERGWVANSTNVGILTNTSGSHCKFHDISYYAADLSFPAITKYQVPSEVVEGFVRYVSSKLLIWLPLIVIIGYYVATLTVTIQLDRRDMKSANVLHILTSNKTGHAYKISIKTGLRMSAGTSSNIKLVLHGTKGTEEVHITQNKEQLFCANQSSLFLYYSKKDLGSIKKITVWIDYTGNQPDWYLEYVKITDNKQPTIYHFVYNNWIGYDVESCGCVINRYDPNLENWSKRLLPHLGASLRNHHTFLSVICKSSRMFPRRKHLSLLFMCRLLIILLLLVYITTTHTYTAAVFILPMRTLFVLTITLPVFYTVEKSIEVLMKNARHNRLATRRLTKADSSSSILTFNTDTYFWVTAEDVLKPDSSESSETDSIDDYFEETKEQGSPHHLNEDSTAHHEGENVSVKDGQISVDEYFKIFFADGASVVSKSSSSLFSFNRMKPLEIQSIVNEKFTSKKLLSCLVKLPYLVSGLVTVLYLVITYTDNKVDIVKCLQQFGIAVSVLLLVEQPLLCLVIGLIHSHKTRLIKHDTDSYCHTKLNNVKDSEGDAKNIVPPKLWTKVLNTRHKMNTVIFKLFSYIVFIVVVIVLSKQDRQTNCYYLNTSVGKVFATPTFANIKNRGDFWSWIKSDFASSLSSEDYYEGTRTDPPKEAYIRDSSSIIISISRMRQVRIKSSNCSNGTPCHAKYSRNLLNLEDYDPGWTEHTPVTPNTPFPTIRYKSYWEYTAEEFGLTVSGTVESYPGGGYIVPLANKPSTARKQVEMLEQHGWIDEFTRGVFVELSVFNPPTGFMCTVKLVAEFLPTGNVVSSSLIHSINFSQYSGDLAPLSMSTEIVYLLCLVLLTLHYIVQCYTATKKSYSVWRGFWTVLDCCTLLSGWGSVYMYVHRYKSIHRAIAQFVDTPYYYIDFHHAAQLDMYFGYCLGALVFLVTVKVVDLVVAHVRIKRMTLIIHNSVVELTSFAIPFFLLLSVFSQVFNCLYSSSLERYSTYFGSMGNTFAFIVGEFEWNDMMAVRPYMTPFFGGILGLVSMAYLANMFAVIVCYNVAEVRINQPNSTQHLAIFSYIEEKLRSLVFLFIPILADVHAVMRKALFKNSGTKARNPYFVEPEESECSTVMINDGSNLAAVRSVRDPEIETAVDCNRCVEALKIKLLKQGRRINKLNELLEKLEIRANTLSKLQTA